MIKQLKLNNFKCFKETNLEFNQLTVLTGFNLTGKSAALESLFLLQQNRKNLISIDFPKLNSYKQVNHEHINNLFYPNSQTAQIEFEFLDKFNDRTYNNDFEILKSDLSVKSNSLDKGAAFQDFFNSDFFYIGSECANEKSIFYKTIRNGENVAFFNRCVKHFNLDLKLDNVHCQYKGNGENKQILDLMKALRNKILFIENNYFDEYHSISNVNRNHVIDRIDLLLSACLSVGCYGMIVIENPELYLHSESQKQLIELLCLLATSGVQVILETQSEYIVNGISEYIKQFANHLSNDNIVHLFKKEIVENDNRTLLPKINITNNKLGY